jgi:hypothetical protein
VDDTLTVTGAVNEMQSSTPMGGQRTFSAIDVDRIELLTKSPGRIEQ